MSGWIEDAEKQIEEAFENGDLSRKEYDAEMRDLYDEIEDRAREAATEAYENALNGY